MLFNSHLDKKWRIVILCISLIVVFVSLDARSNVIKFTVPFLLSFLIYFKRYLKLKILKILLISGFSLPFVFLVLGITNIFNVFQIWL